MIKVIFLLIFSFFVPELNAQENTSDSTNYHKEFSYKELKHDLDILRDSLMVSHPALYRYIPKKSFDAAFNSAYKKISKPMRLFEFYGVVAPLLSIIGDIHTTTSLPEEYISYIGSKSDLLPLDVRIINKDVFIASNNSFDSSIAVGSKIISVNNQPIESVLTRMRSYFSADGANQTFKLKMIEQRFAFHYHFVYGYSKKFKIQYTDKSKQIKTKVIDAVPFSTIKINRTKNAVLFPKLKSLFPKPPYLALTFNRDRTAAILTIKWFQNDVLAENSEQFKPFIDSSFLKIKKTGINNLIIDIRNNGGGESENASYLYSWLSSKSFPFLYYMETNKKNYGVDKKRKVEYSFISHSQKYRVTDTLASSISPQFFGLGMQLPHPDNFNGDVYVLIDGLTTSAAPQFASLIRQNKRGRLIGEEAPGSLYGGCGRGYSYFALPNTGLMTMISLYRVGLINPERKEKDVCIVPNFTTSYSIIDVLNGIDKDIEYAISLINTGNKK